MRTVLIATVFAAAAMVFAGPARSFGQTASDSMYVPPVGSNGQPDLFEVISGDTTATGARQDPNRVYVLQTFGTTDTTYFLDNTITMTAPYNLTIVGKINPASGHPPVIEPIVNADNTTPDPFVLCDTGNVKIQGVYLLGIRPDGVAQTSTLINSTGNYTSITLDHCVIDNFYGGNTNLIQHHGIYDDLFLTNCDFRNIQSSLWPKGAIYWELTKGPIDTLWYQDNTFFCVNGSYFGSGWYAQYVRFDHNTCFLGSGPPLKFPQAINMDINDNVFYGLVAHAGDSTQSHSTQFGGLVDYPNIVDIDTLSTLAAPPYNAMESGRHVTVTDNAYCWPSALVNFWKAYNDTTHDPLIPPVFMDSLTAANFNNKTRDPYLYAANNDSVDPGFPSSLTSPALDSIVEYEYLIWSTGNVGTYTWAQLPTDPANIFNNVPSNWAKTQGYPVPEDLAYTNAQLQHASGSGQALGDLNWFPSQLPLGVKISPAVPGKFALSQNYPNPFNPSTEIKVDLARSGRMSLTIYNVLGQVVDLVAQGYKPAGEYTYNINMDRFASGVYFYSLRVGAGVITKKMLLLK